jgi:hypothetical protein
MSALSRTAAPFGALTIHCFTPTLGNFGLFPWASTPELPIEFVVKFFGDRTVAHPVRNAIVN